MFSQDILQRLFNKKVMDTNLGQNETKTKIPAGIFAGIEAFWYNDEKWIIMEGKVMRFYDSPSRVQRMVATAFMKDKAAHSYMRKIAGDPAFSRAFDFWYRCKLGALDEVPDFIDGNLNADYYNHACSDFECPHRGKFCSLGPGLENYEIKTITMMQQGLTIEEAAEKLHITHSGLRQRIEKLKEKLGAKNMAELIAISSRIGISTINKNNRL